MLTEKQTQFIFKRTMFQKISAYISWSVGFSTAAAWGVIYWFKPEMVSSQSVLELIKGKNDSGIDLTHITDIALLAVTGATAVSALFVLIILLAIMMNIWGKKEKQYLDIIAQLEKDSL